MSACAKTGVPKQFCTCIECQKPAEELPIVTVNGDGECTEVTFKGAVIWKLGKPTAPPLRQAIDDLKQLLRDLDEDVNGMAGVGLDEFCRNENHDRLKGILK